MFLPASYLLSMPVRMRELLPRLASVSLSWSCRGDRTSEGQLLVLILNKHLSNFSLTHSVNKLKLFLKKTPLVKHTPGNSPSDVFAQLEICKWV